ncbi:MAG: cupin [Dehalococcoidia bacterium]|jgi:quercetin dioxygenase-like cupin family protein|nr:cupin [Dehalococcoidia bacterium]|tara:strand:+ start:1801 stop:2127 length:327 start_codon:yes stop_codon:yes gene_type:complete
MAVYKQSKMNLKELFPGIIVRPVWGEKIMMMLVDIAPNAEVPLHSHPHEQAGRVLSGSFWLSIDGKDFLLQEGDHYVIPSGVMHSAKGIDTPSLALDIFNPPREEYKF